MGLGHLHGSKDREAWQALRAQGPYSVLVIDPPWDHYGSPDKWAAAGKYYQLMPDSELMSLRIQDICAKRAIVFIWST